MNAFFIGLQFLTRIKLRQQSEWSAEYFGKSVKFFPLIGAVLGLILAAAAYVFFVLLPIFNIYLPAHLTASMLLILSVVLTGGLHCDGFMDTMDGIFSGRERERMLEIMKDSCVGSNAVMAFVLFMLTKWSLLLDMSGGQLIVALFVMPIIARMAMVIGITLFPYARPEGMGKAFAVYANKKSLFYAAIFTFVFILPFGFSAIISMVGVFIFAILFGRYCTKILGGLTGDVYGALTELSELLVLCIFVLVVQIL
ncbi:cobalamin-5'-phosphate synthase [Propionispira arboris]|uniref:Adenosylcobinamide-GDP ribazoletransferase n=1 Tax=Propionispira arboris TaxID=84035 RepID=A0A1H6W112_9FIRM|nr:adenosylcobinamide-GDP ribazoletransferase [Propionispira arboris]SEJ10629.1 cobalamin-5'-phosphate synthase [Propionispira arboris]